MNPYHVRNLFSFVNVCRSDDRFSVLVPEVRRLCHHQTLLGGDTDAQENLGDEVDLLLSILASRNSYSAVFLGSSLFSTSGPHDRGATIQTSSNQPGLHLTSWGISEALPKGAHLLAQIDSP